jgi:hypothetical protein
MSWLAPSGAVGWRGNHHRPGRASTRLPEVRGEPSWRHIVAEASDTLDPDAVHDRESFLAFVAALAADRRGSVAAEEVEPGSPYSPAAGGWENVTIEDFLEAALAWAESTGMGESQGLQAVPTWRGFAAFLYCGKIYE